MKKILGGVLFGAVSTLGLVDDANAQSVPNYGNYEGLDGNFRIGVQLAAPAFGLPNVERSFEQSTIDEITSYLDPFEIAAYINQPTLGAIYSQVGRISGVFDLQGVPVIAGYAENSSVLTLRFVDPGTGNTISAGAGNVCSFTYNGATRQESFNQFDTEVDDGSSATAQRITQCLGTARSRFSPVDPLVGNPFSLQGTMARSALDLTEGDSLVEIDPAAGANSAGDPWIIGGQFASGSAGRFDITRIDARIAKGWRVFEGNRARLKLDLPFSFTRIKGATAYNGQIGLALEVPIKTNWSLEPRVSYGIVYSADQGSVGHIAQGSVASRYVIRGLGRGQLVIGNMVGYSATLKTPGDINLNPDVKNWLFRNGAAYELPLKMRVMDRATSLRASYTFTNFAGDKLYNNNFHEGTISFGLRGREDTPKQFRDVMRLIFSTVQAKGFSTYTAGLGFRF
ncbi:hypothetical protein GGQ88_001961 [Novosphingobium hassiacum]|uniref:Uncharacterized protein n=1 Tax=Novosphingobium hassiacum TaxID=173676 RepID=A0A7W5ZYP4_9SPHN|nr:hypothetical protein [Novosphingobium hassiacum]MBB3860692.1 hypothetical protein [Novosphingobium hassiacum]